MSVAVKVDRRVVARFDGSALIGWTPGDEALAYARELFEAFARRGRVLPSWWDKPRPR